MEINKLERQIEDAFSEMHPPDGERLCIAGRWFDENGEGHEYINDEALHYQSFFQGKTWHDLVGKPLVNWGAAAFSALRFLNTRARVYYLPAYMLTALRNYHENPDLVEGLFYGLAPPEGAQFSEAQSENVLASIDNSGDSLPTELKNSLKETFKHTDFKSALQRDAVMHSLDQDYEDFLNKLSPAQKLAIREFILYMRKNYKIENLDEKAFKGYWGKGVI